MTDEQIKVLEAMVKYGATKGLATGDVTPEEQDALTAALDFIRDMREIEAAAEYVIIGEHHLCRFNVGWKDGPHGAAFNHLREAFKSVKGGKE